MQKHNKDIYLIGAGGHAKVILALLEAQRRKCLGIYDDNEQRHGTTLLDVPKQQESLLGLDQWWLNILQQAEFI